MIKKNFYLKLTLARCERISEEGLKSINQALSKLTLLKAFNLNLNSCHEKTDTVVMNLSQELVKISGLEDFSLNWYIVSSNLFTSDYSKLWIYY